MIVDLEPLGHLCSAGLGGHHRLLGAVRAGGREAIPLPAGGVLQPRSRTPHPARVAPNPVLRRWVPCDSSHGHSLRVHPLHSCFQRGMAPCAFTMYRCSSLLHVSHLGMFVWSLRCEPAMQAVLGPSSSGAPRAPRTWSCPSKWAPRRAERRALAARSEHSLNCPSSSCGAMDLFRRPMMFVYVPYKITICAAHCADL